jgi:hypothetical protein
MGFSKKSGYLSCPFDLCITTHDALKKCLETDFQFFYDNLHLKNISDIGSYPLRGNINRNKADIFNGYGIRFNHESPTHSHLFRNGRHDDQFYIRNNFSEFKKRYNARIANFRHYMASSSEVCLIFSYNFYEKIEEILVILRKRYPTVLFTYKCI